VTKPFLFEGPRRKKSAEMGIQKLQEHVDTLIIVPNDRLLGHVDKKTTMKEAFSVADDVLRQGVQGISDIIMQPGMINVDFADVRSVMKDAGVALMGLGKGSGAERARIAAQAATNSPLLETSIQGAKKLLVNITAGMDFTLNEAHEAMEYILQFADAEEAEIFMGHVLKEDQPDGEVFISILATGMSQLVNSKSVSKSMPITNGNLFGELLAQADPSPKMESLFEKPAPVGGQSDKPDLDIPSFLKSYGSDN
jgi:cell division protein FtsZ